MLRLCHRFFDIKIVLATWMSPEACLERKALVRISNTASMNFIPTHFFSVLEKIFIWPPLALKLSTTWKLTILDLYY